MSPYHFHRVFKAVTGLTPKAYAAAQRGRRLRETLGRSSRVTDAVLDAGFNSSARFYETAGSLLGMTPRDYRAGAAGVTMQFAVGSCSLGRILVARTSKGVCAILLGDDDGSLTRELRGRFPRATLQEGDPTFAQTVRTVIAFVEAPAVGLDLPLDVRGTAFQHRVWQALQTIPPGATASYGDIAARLGTPAAARAVARACATNPLAVAIPCHRVVRADGAISGYRWGVDRKRRLLQRERAEPGE